MITQENLKSVIDHLPPVDKTRIMEADYSEYICISLSIYNAGSISRVEWISPDTDREDLENDTECLFEAGYLQDMIENN